MDITQRLLTYYSQLRLQTESDVLRFLFSKITRQSLKHYCYEQVYITEWVQARASYSASPVGRSTNYTLSLGTIGTCTSTKLIIRWLQGWLALSI